MTQPWVKEAEGMSMACGLSKSVDLVMTLWMGGRGPAWKNPLVWHHTWARQYAPQHIPLSIEDRFQE